MVNAKVLAVILSTLVATAAAVAGVFKLHNNQEVKLERLDERTEAHDEVLDDVNVVLSVISEQMTEVRVGLSGIQTEQRAFKEEVLRALEKRSP